MILSWLIVKVCKVVMYPFDRYIESLVSIAVQTHLSNDTVDDVYLTRCKDNSRESVG